MSCKIHNNSEYDISEMKPLVRNLYGFAKDKFGFKKPPSINFVSDEANHPMLGKTAHYDPSSMEVTVYVDGRHPKDMMRSIAHELVHHTQNERGMFDNEHVAGEGYAQKDPHLRKMEEQAYLEGNMCFRDWEDQYKSKNKDIFYERRIRKMSTKKWKNKELNGLLNERWGFSMDLSKLNENSKPDYIDIDGDGDKEESMKDAAKDKKEGSDDEEKIEEISMGHGIAGTISGAKSDKEEAEDISKGAKNIRPDMRARGNKPNDKKSKMEEGESTKEQLKDSVDDLDAESLKELEKFLNQMRAKNNPPPNSSGGSDSGAPAKASLEEKKEE